MKVSNPDFTVERIVERMKAAAGGRKDSIAAGHPVGSAAGSGPPVGLNRMTDGSGLPQVSDIQQLLLQPSFKPSLDDHYNVTDLLKYHDHIFLQNAYRAILKRDPDLPGYNGFVESLSSGRLNKVDVLARLRFSAEGRAKRVQVDGLLFPATIRKMYRVPIVGYLLNLLVAIVRLPVMIRSDRQFEAYVLGRQEQIVAYANQMAGSIRAQQQEISRALDHQVDSLTRLDNQSQQQFEVLKREQEAAHEVVLRRFVEFTTYLEDRQNEEAAQRQQDIFALARNLGEATSHWQKEFAQVQTHLQTRAQAQEDFQAQVMREFQGQTLTLEQIRADFKAQVHDLREALRVAEAEIHQNEDAHTLDAFYASFDEQFRGSRAEIGERLKVYLPLIRKNRIGSAELPILDVGCGRGEWLELLKQEDLRAVGVDSNRIHVGQCLERGLDVAESDLMEYIGGLPDASLGAVTGFHIVEHLSIETLLEFLGEAVRVIKSGGVVIFETPNPQNVLVGSCNFYFDPTHRHPLPSQVMRFLVESRGFVQVEILKLNPSDETPVEGDSELASRFNRYFYGPMDYAVVGWKT